MDMEHNFFFFSFFLLVFLLYMDFNFYWMFGQMGLPDHSTTLKLVISSGLHQTMTSCQNTQALEHQPSKQAYHVCFKSHGNCCGLAICIHMTKGLLCALSQQPKSRFLIEVMAVKRFRFHAEECTVACKKFLKTFLKSVLSKNATRLGKEKIVAGVPGRNFKLAC